MYIQRGIVSSMADKGKNRGKCCIWAIMKNQANKQIMMYLSVEPDYFRRGCVYFKVRARKTKLKDRPSTFYVHFLLYASLAGLSTV